MSDYLGFLWEILDDLPEVIRKITEVQTALQAHQKSVIAANETIKEPDETVDKSPVEPSQVDSRSESFVDLEVCPDGVYRPRRGRLTEKE